MNKHGAKMTDERRIFISENWETMTDKEMGLKLDISKGSVSLLRQSLKFFRIDVQAIPNEKKAFVVNAFFNDIRMKAIMQMTTLSYNQVKYIIEQNCFFKKRSYNTITLVMDSKVNY